MNYEETCDYLFNKTANYESQGKDGYKVGLDTMLALDKHFGHPHQYFKTIHVAGTNGKGSVSHMLAAILQVCGYRVGLYTSPHLVDFSERIRVCGHPISEDYVTSFVEAEKPFFDSVNATFFEITTAMAFQYFRDQDVDIAVVEVGLGGRLDSTNIITPIVSVITNISLDHTHLLGTSVEQIAMEKAGIMKPGVPVIIGEALPETRVVFDALAQETGSPVIYAEDHQEVVSVEPLDDGTISCKTNHVGSFVCGLGGLCQQKNVNTVMPVLLVLKNLGYLCDCVSQKNLEQVQSEMNQALRYVKELTGLRGRWEKVKSNPTVVCDTGHNVGAWQLLSQQLAHVEANHKHIIYGVLSDKDVYGVMSLLPKDATYYFTKGSTKRAMPETSVQVFGQQLGLMGEAYPTVAEAFKAAMTAAQKSDFIFVGGSTYVVADFLKTCI